MSTQLAMCLHGDARPERVRAYVRLADAAWRIVNSRLRVTPEALEEIRRERDDARAALLRYDQCKACGGWTGPRGE